MKTIAIIASCDTKYKEAAYMRERIEAEGLKALVINTATGSGESFGFDISREEVVRRGGAAWEDLSLGTKGEKIAFMTKAVSDLTEELYKKEEIHGVLAAGGLQNTVMAAAAMQRLPIGFPKVMATTIASGTKTFDMVVGDRDIVAIPSICDFTGLNMVTSRIMDNACACCVGMVKTAGGIVEKSDKPVVAVSLMGITNEGACAAVETLERHGAEVIGFHTTGVGGMIMEQMAEDKLVDGILDLTTHEVTSDFFKGGFSYNEALSERLVKVGKRCIPLVVSVGGLDFVDFCIKEFPDRMDERVYMMHNETTAHIKILPDEAVEVGKIFAQRLNNIPYPLKLLIPTEGMRHNTGPGQELYSSETDKALIDTIIADLGEHIELIYIEGNLDTKEWGTKAAGIMLDALKG